MAKSASSKLDWCVIRLGEDMNWWVEEISDNVHWDVDGLSIVDPRQMNHLMDLVDPLRDYDFRPEVFEDCFFKFKIDKKLDDKRLRLVRVKESLFDSEEPIFGLPDLIDEEKGPYADFLDHVTRLRVKFLNDSIDFEKKLTVEELEEEVREEQNNDFMEGRAVHVFSEICSILEYVPAGFEGELEDDSGASADSDYEPDFPDLDDEEEKIEEDDTMKWDGDEDEEDEDSTDEEESEERLDDLDDDEDDEIEERPQPKSRKRKSR